MAFTVDHGNAPKKEVLELNVNNRELVEEIIERNKEFAPIVKTVGVCYEGNRFYGVNPNNRDFYSNGRAPIKIPEGCPSFSVRYFTDGYNLICFHDINGSLMYVIEDMVTRKITSDAVAANDLDKMITLLLSRGMVPYNPERVE